jgi:hypothetical protein
MFATYDPLIKRSAEGNTESGSDDPSPEDSRHLECAGSTGWQATTSHTARLRPAVL